MGLIYSIVAGMLMSIQGVFNTRASEKIGLWEINLIVHSSGFILALALFFIIGNGHLNKISSVNKLYLLGGVVGVIIIFAVMKGVSEIGPALANMTILTAQLLLAYGIEAFGLFGTKAIGFEWSKIIGVFIMMAGIIIFQWRF